MPIFCLGPLAPTFFSSRARATHSAFDVPGRNGRDVLETVEFFAAGHSPKCPLLTSLELAVTTEEFGPEPNALGTW